MERIRRILPIILIVLVGLILRFWRLDSYPALNADEAAIGYNAFSLIQTGKDEHGNSWPIHFQSFNDYKPGLYFYLVLPFVKVLGLNEWAVRLPGATLGVLTVLIVYLLVRELFSEQKNSMAEIAALILAISPWHLHFSRGGWEVNVSTFFITLGVLFFLKSLKNPKNFAFCIFNFALAMYTYHAARIIVPLLGLGMVVIYRKQIFVKENFKTLIINTLFLILFLTPLIKDLAGPAGIARVAGVGLFADPGPLNRINEQRGEHTNFTSLSSKIIHNKAVNYGLAFAQNWAEHFHGEFLFLSGDEIQRNKVSETGQLYLFEIVTVGLGLILIARNSAGWGLVLWWLIVAPTAAALTFQSPHALRAHNMVVPLTIISAYGLVKIWDFFGKQSRRLLVIGHWSLVILVIWQFARYEHEYWVHMAKEYPFSSQYGLKELATFIAKNQDRYQKIIITNRYDQPYILLLFYLKYSPEKFQQEHIVTSRDRFGFSTVSDFGKFHFQEVDFDKIRPENPDSLIVGTDEEIPEEANIIKKIYGSNGYHYFDVVAN